MKNKNFVPYLIAVELKKRGFDEMCFGYYLDGELNTFHNSPMSDRTNTNNPVSKRKLDCTAPLWQQATDWLRKEHKIQVEVYIDGGYDDPTYMGGIHIPSNYDEDEWSMGECQTEDYEDYYEALKEGIEIGFKGIDIL